MVLSHGDENYGNVLVPKDSEQDYVAIDARFAGYYDPAWVLANLVSRTYLFNGLYPSSVDVMHDGKIAVVSEFAPLMPKATEEINARVLQYVSEREAVDPYLSTRVAAYMANNIGRSIAHYRDKSFAAACDMYGKQHYLSAISVARKLSQRAA